jgi:catechol 2,3-dioxygenase-like lactoylglutathione lyase family enzyme
MKKIKGICIITQDVPRLRGFYRDVLQTNSEGDDVFSTFVNEGTQLSLCNEQVMEQMAPNSMAGTGRGSVTLEVEVEDVDREHQRLSKNHIPIVKPPTTQAWGLRSVWLRDPDGNLVNLFAKVGGGKLE